MMSSTYLVPTAIPQEFVTVTVSVERVDDLPERPRGTVTLITRFSGDVPLLWRDALRLSRALVLAALRARFGR
jgi:hypothetical protein